MENSIRPFFSIAIPTWEINGKGTEYLEFSFTRIAHQTFTDFEVVVSDHSKDDEIKNLCDQWSTYMPIRYVRCENGRGRIAPNMNSAIKACKGKWIKILFQDDFLYDQHSLKHIHESIQINSDSNWFLTGCVHTKDAETVYDQMIPFYHPRIYAGVNTISCPTVLTIRNEDPLLFDESLNWLVDCVYYKELWDNFGHPIIIPEICAVNRDAEIRTTNMMTEEQKRDETLRIIQRYEKKIDLSRVTLIAFTSVRIDEHVRALEYSSQQIKFGSIKIVSDAQPTYLPKGIEHHYIEPMKNIDDWSHSIIYKMSKYVDTEFAILIHDDGFIVNPHAWREEFFEYDYIGAPWPIPNDNISYRDVHGNLIRVGNSVSLRSKKLIDLPVKLNLEWKPFHGFYNEDGFITVNYRHKYIEHGCKFADIDVAKYFSHEAPIPEIQGIEPFAFHGKNHPYYRQTRKIISRGE